MAICEQSDDGAKRKKRGNPSASKEAIRRWLDPANQDRASHDCCNKSVSCDVDEGPSLLKLNLEPSLACRAAVLWSHCQLTILLSGLARCPFRTGERAIRCEHGVATIGTGPLQRVVRTHHALYQTNVPRATRTTTTNP